MGKKAKAMMSIFLWILIFVWCMIPKQPMYFAALHLFIGIHPLNNFKIIAIIVIGFNLVKHLVDNRHFDQLSWAYK